MSWRPCPAATAACHWPESAASSGGVSPGAAPIARSTSLSADSSGNSAGMRADGRSSSVPVASVAVSVAATFIGPGGRLPGSAARSALVPWLGHPLVRPGPRAWLSTTPYGATCWGRRAVVLARFGRCPRRSQRAGARSVGNADHFPPFYLLDDLFRHARSGRDEADHRPEAQLRRRRPIDCCPEEPGPALGDTPAPAHPRRPCETHRATSKINFSRKPR
jgi:hypothetical protein